MKPIKILPHHAHNYFEPFFLKRKPGENSTFYDSDSDANARSLIERVVSNPSQLVQIVSRYDSICSMCPRNMRGLRFVEPERVCKVYEDSDFGNELEIAKRLGIDHLIDQAPITAEEFFKAMKPVYDKIFTEEVSPHSKQIPLRVLFRVSPSERLFLNQ